MEIHQLRYFCAVARTGNFSRAAEQEHVAQPSLSQQIMKLEAELGAKLFDRLGRSVSMTRFGEAFQKRAQAVLRELGQARSEVQQMSGIEGGRVVLGAIVTVAPYLLPIQLATFAGTHPNIELTVIEDILLGLSKLHSGGIDVALLALPAPGRELICEEILTEPLRVVVPENHRLAAKQSISLKEIGKDLFLLVKEGHCFRKTTIEACHRARVASNVIFESGQFATILGMVAAGIGVSVITKMAAEPRAGCRFLEITDSLAFCRIGFVWLRSYFQSCAELALTRYFLRYLNIQSSGTARVMGQGLVATGEGRLLLVTHAFGALLSGP